MPKQHRPGFTGTATNAQQRANQNRSLTPIGSNYGIDKYVVKERQLSKAERRWAGEVVDA